MPLGRARVGTRTPTPNQLRSSPRSGAESWSGGSTHPPNADRRPAIQASAATASTAMPMLVQRLLNSGGWAIRSARNNGIRTRGQRTRGREVIEEDECLRGRQQQPSSARQRETDRSSHARHRGVRTARPESRQASSFPRGRHTRGGPPSPAVAQCARQHQRAAARLFMLRRDCPERERKGDQLRGERILQPQNEEAASAVAESRERCRPPRAAPCQGQQEGADGGEEQLHARGHRVRHAMGKPPVRQAERREQGRLRVAKERHTEVGQRVAQREVAVFDDSLTSEGLPRFEVHHGV